MTSSVVDELPDFEAAEVHMQQLAEKLTSMPRFKGILSHPLYERDILLSPGAYLMLVIPVFEALKLEARRKEAGIDAAELQVNMDVVAASIRTLLETVVEEAAAADIADDRIEGDVVVRRPSRILRPRRDPIGPRRNYRTSLSVIRAFWRRYCNIPPFCGRAPDIQTKSNSTVVL